MPAVNILVMTYSQSKQVFLLKFTLLVAFMLLDTTMYIHTGPGIKMLCGIVVLLSHSMFIRSHLLAGCWVKLDVLAALWAQDVIAFSQKATADQGHGALFAVEAVVVPLALLEGNILAASQS